MTNSLSLRLSFLAAFLLVSTLPISASAATRASSCTTAKSASCAQAATGTLDLSRLYKKSVSGTASSTTKVSLSITDATTGKSITKKSATVKKSGTWKATVSKKLREGTYAAYLSAKDGTLLAQAHFSVNEDGEIAVSDGSSVSVSMVPLLFGGAATRGTEVPVAYVKVSNTGKTDASVTGITLAQNGTASDSEVIGFSTIDNKGGSVGSVGGREGSGVVKSREARVALAATLKPGEYRIFTIKAMVGANASVGSTIAFDLKGIETAGSVKGAFPIKGTTWVVGR